MTVTASHSWSRPVSVPSLRRPLSSAGTTVLTCVSGDNGGSAVSEAKRRYEEARQSRPVDCNKLDSIVDRRPRGPFTQQHNMRPLSEPAGYVDLFPPSSGGGVLLQPAWNDSIAADWNKRLPYSGQDALVGSDDVEAVHEAGPLTQQYKQHIRRASLDTRTFGRLWEVENARLRLERMPANERPPADYFFHGHVRLTDTALWDQQHKQRVQQQETRKQRLRDERSRALAQKQTAHWTQQRSDSGDGDRAAQVHVVHVKLSDGCPAQQESTFQRVIGGQEGGSKRAQVAFDHFRFHADKQADDARTSERAQRLACESRGRRDIHLITNQLLQPL